MFCNFETPFVKLAITTRIGISSISDPISFFGRLKSEIKKSGWFFSILYLGIIAYVVLSISTENIKALSFEAIIIISVIVILDFLNRLVKKKSEKLFKAIIILKKTCTTFPFYCK